MGPKAVAAFITGPFGGLVLWALFGRVHECKALENAFGCHNVNMFGGEPVSGAWLTLGAFCLAAAAYGLWPTRNTDPS